MKSLVQKTEEAQELVRALIEVQEQTRRIDVLKGRILWRLKSGNLFKKAFGEGADTWEEFLRSPEIALTVSEANRAMQLYEYFVVKYKFDEQTLSGVPVKSLHHMLPRIKSGEIKEDDLPELISAAQTLTFNQFKERMYDVQNDESAIRTYSYSIMRRCKETGNLTRVQSISEEAIRNAFPYLDDA